MEPSRRETRSALAAALQRRDTAAAGACYAEDAQFLTPTAGLIQGRRAIEAYWGTGIALGLSSVSFETLHVELMDARRVEIGRYRITVETEGADARSERGTYLALHRQAGDGSWVRAVDVLEPDEPHGSSATQQGVQT